MIKNPIQKPRPPRDDDTPSDAAAEPGAARDGPRARPMLSEKQVLALIPIARSTLWRLEATGRFPQGVYIPGANRKLYLEAEVRHWQDAMDGQVGRRRRPRRKTPKSG
jgi:predicted DNA-binding transcriptional regulator AlpA